MNGIKGTYHNGQIILTEPTNWAEGTEVLVQPISPAVTLGMKEEDWLTTPEAIAAWIQWYDSLEPLELTPEEEAAWQETRRVQKGPR